MWRLRRSQLMAETRVRCLVPAARAERPLTSRRIRKAPASVCYDRGLASALSGSTGADVGGLQQRQNTYRTRRSSRPPPTHATRQTRRGEGLCSAPGTPRLIGHYLASLETLRPRAPRHAPAQRARWRLEATLRVLKTLPQEPTRVQRALFGSRVVRVPQEPPASCGPSRPPSSSQRSWLLLLSL